MIMSTAVAHALDQNMLLLESPLFHVLGLENRYSIFLLNEITSRQEKYQVYLIRDDNPEMVKAYKLWYEVYIEEKGYPLDDERATWDSKLYKEPPENSVLFVLTHKDQIIGTFKFKDSRYNHLEFDYNKYLKDTTAVQEISKFIFLKSHRNRVLSSFLIKTGNDYLKKNLPADYYGINSALNMIPYYSKIGFSVVSPEIIHPVIGNVSRLLVSETNYFNLVINKLWTMLNSHLLSVS